jgi:hypothetical protein
MIFSDKTPFNPIFCGETSTSFQNFQHLDMPSVQKPID